MSTARMIPLLTVSAAARFASAFQRSQGVAASSAALFFRRACLLLTTLFTLGMNVSALQAAVGSRDVPDSPVKPAVVSNDYKILPADILEISVFQEPDLKATLRVSNEGTVTFPLIGVVPVVGLSPQEAATEVQKRLAKGYLVSPQVSLTVMEFSKRRFTVLGEVQKPGSYDMPDQQDVTVLQAIGMAGGYTRIANPSRVTLMRRTGGKQTSIELNARRMAGGSEPPFQVSPGDVITVAESRF